MSGRFGLCYGKAAEKLRKSCGNYKEIIRKSCGKLRKGRGHCGYIAGTLRVCTFEEIVGATVRTAKEHGFNVHNYFACVPLPAILAGLFCIICGTYSLILCGRATCFIMIYIDIE